MAHVFEGAKWIRSSEECASPLFLKTFECEAAHSAVLHICGMGFFELYINGQRVGEDLFVPAWSQYESLREKKKCYPLDDPMDSRTYYMTYDVNAYLREGENTIGVWLGNGWYRQEGRCAEGDLVYGKPKLCFMLALEGQSGICHHVQSDLDMLWRESGIEKTNIYYGEKQDVGAMAVEWRQDGRWRAPVEAEAPSGILQVQDCPADKVIRTIRPAIIHREKGRVVYDAGENITGYVLVTCPAAKGEVVTVLHAENYNKETKTLDFATAGSANQIQTCEYVCAKEPVQAHSKFTWQAFRFFQVQGPEGTKVDAVHVVHADIQVLSTFESSNETLNWIYDAYIRTQLGNIHCGVPSDCPHRERLGYTGDGQVTSESAMLCLDSKTLFDKWMRDIVDGQNKENGHVQHTAPFYGGGGGPGGWGGAMYVVPWHYYLYYGDSSMLKAYFPNILLWLEYMHSRCENGLVVREEEGGWCLGDWCAPELLLPPEYVNTYYYIKGIQTVLKASRKLGLFCEAAVLEARMSKSMSALCEKYYDGKTGSFFGGINGADAFAVDIGIGNEKTLEALVARYQGANNFDTGIFGTYILIKVLFEHRFDDIAFSLLTCTGDHSFDKMRREGATTIWERWNNWDHSHNHPMFGGVVGLFFLYILGIRPREDGTGFDDPLIEPARIGSLDWVKGSLQTPWGKIAVEVRKGVGGEQVVSHLVRSKTSK